MSFQNQPCYFSPSFLVESIVTPLRHFFSLPQTPKHVRWSANLKETQIEIGQALDLLKIEPTRKPRIIVNRGSYMIGKVGLTDNLGSAKEFKDTGGIKDLTNMVLINGQSTLTIDSRTSGECEMLADMVSHFITWSRPALCGSQGFKEFGLPMQVSDIGMSKEDAEIFQVQISIPWQKEEEWRVHTEALKIKNIFTHNLAPGTPAPEYKHIKIDD